MKKQLQNSRFYFICALTSSFIATAIQSVAYLSAYGELGANYFSSASPLPKISVILALIACACGIGSFLTWKKFSAVFRDPRNDFASLPSAVGFLAGAILMALSNDTKLTYTIVFFFVLAFGYHLCLTFGWIKDAYANALLGFPTVIGSILLCGYYYFDATLEMNAPVKVSILSGLLFAMMYYTGELRILIGASVPRVHLFFNVCTLGIGSLASLPLVLAYLLGKFDRLFHVKTNRFMVAHFTHPEYLVGSVVLLGICISITWRLIRAIKNAPATQTLTDSEEKA